MSKQHGQSNSNYFDMASTSNASEVLENQSNGTKRTLFRTLSSMKVLSSNAGTYYEKNGERTFQDEGEISSCCEKLALLFGFQRGSVNNQKEHLILLLVNYRTRENSGELTLDGYVEQVDDDAYFNHVAKLHSKVFFNYRRWCSFLKATPMFSDDSLYMDMCLQFLIWGEAGNVRHMPEAICYLYHQMMGQLRDLESKNSGLENHYVPHGDFLKRIVRPICNLCANMKTKNKNGKFLEHSQVCNYDDYNEFFWKRRCLKYAPDQVAMYLEKHHGKTFMEHRSMFTFLLNFYRIHQFNGIFFVAIVVLAINVTISEGGGESGFGQFSKLGQIVAPYSSKDVARSLVLLPFTHAFLSLIKCVLEFLHGFKLAFKMKTYMLTLLARLTWNTFGTIFFAVMIAMPDSIVFSNTTMIDIYHVATITFLLPALTILISQSVFPQYLLNSWGRHFIREGSTSFVGKQMGVPFSRSWIYIVFWIVLWIIKFAVSYVILIKPLVLPSAVIYDMTLEYSNSSVSFHNMGVIVALWLPILFVFMYDTQIYFSVLQALVGSVKGLMLRTGEVHGLRQLSQSFRIAPQLFDQKIVPTIARQKGEHSSSQLMLRFVVIWNEIVNSFREGDLVDDKEAAILQYDIQVTGEVYEPVFLSAGKLSEAIALVSQFAKAKRPDSQLHIRIVKQDCVSALKSFYNSTLLVFETLFGQENADVIEGIVGAARICQSGGMISRCKTKHIHQLRFATIELLEAILDLPEPEGRHAPGIVKNFVARLEQFLGSLQAFCPDPAIVKLLGSSTFSDIQNASDGLLNLFSNDVAMGAATRAFLLLSLEKADAMPKCQEAQRRLGFFMKSLGMDIPNLPSIRKMHSFSVITPFYSESVLFTMEELQNPIENHPIFHAVEEDGKNITILRYLTTIHPHEWENFLERIDVGSGEEALSEYPQQVRLWASARGQTLSRTVQGMMLYEDAIKILHWLEIGSDHALSPTEKQDQLEDMVRLKFSYICACQVYGKHRLENKPQAADIEFLLHTYPNLRVAYVDTKVNPDSNAMEYDTVLIKSENDTVSEVYRYELPGNPILGEGKPENQNNAIPFTRGEFVQTIDMNQEHYFEEALKMPHLLQTADMHSSGKPVSIIGMREHIFTGNASSLAKFKTFQELVFVTLTQRVLADPFYCRMHYGHPDVFDKLLTITRGGVSKASRGINLSEDVFAGFNTTLRGGIITHVEFMQCGKGRDVALSQISMFEGKIANGSGETSLSRDVHRLGQFMDFFRLNSMYYSHTGFYFATWLTIVTTFVYIYSKLYIALAGVGSQIIENTNQSVLITANEALGFEDVLFNDFKDVINAQYLIQAGLFLTVPLIAVYLTEMGMFRGLLRFMEMIFTMGPAFFVFQVGTTSHYFDNNLLHGGAKYQATGRGFKITRESFVLLYKAYSQSHYQKALELVGLSLMYLTYGDFSICITDKTNDLGIRFCDTSQGFGAQTFAIWFIAVLWLLSPFFFNTDGLDWTKSKVDVENWMKWMFMARDQLDLKEDHTNDGGWISWWSSGLEVFQLTSNSARIAVFIRESRHFILVWYVVCLSFAPIAVLYVMLTAIATIVFMVPLSMKWCCSKISPQRQAGLVIVLLATILVSFALICSSAFDLDSSKTLSLFFGYVAALYGFKEIIPVFHGVNFDVTRIQAYQKLAFLFDFVFGCTLLLPLCILSAIPFMNVIQTRMMYNEGFSKVMSASSQYAFSLCAFTGVFGGVSVGWMTYSLTSLGISANFINFITRYQVDTNGGSTTYVVLIAAIVGVLLNIGISNFLGRKMSIVLGGALNLLGVVAVCGVVDVSIKLYYPGISLLGASIGVLTPALPMYCYEIATKSFRSASVLLVCVGYLFGIFLASYFLSSSGNLGWLWQIFWSGILIAIVTPAMNLFPESPSWILSRQGEIACEDCLVVLRRRQDVEDELAELKADEALSKSTEDIFSKLFLVSLLQLCYTFGTLGLNIYVATLYNEIQSDSLMLTNALCVQIAGSMLAFMFIDRIQHQTILSYALVICAMLATLIGLNDAASLWSTADTPLTDILILILYFVQGFGITPMIWLCSFELFSGMQRTLNSNFSFLVFFVAPMGTNLIRLEFADWYYSFLIVYAIVSILAAAVVAFGFSCRESGTLCTQTDKRKEIQYLNAQQMRPGSTFSLRSNRAFNRSRNRSSNHSQNNSLLKALDSPSSIVSAAKKKQ